MNGFVGRGGIEGKGRGRGEGKGEGRGKGVDLILTPKITNPILTTENSECAMKKYFEATTMLYMVQKFGHLIFNTKSPYEHDAYRA